MNAKAKARPKPTALVADDDAVLRGLLMRALTDLGFACLGASSVDEALAAPAPDLAVLDVRMPGDGLQAVAPLVAKGTCVVLLTGYGSIPLAVEAVKLGAADVLTKPCDAERIVAVHEKWLTERAGTTDRELAVRDSKSLRTASPRSSVAPAPSLWRVEWEHLQRTLADCGGSVSEAARRLGMHRRSLQRKLKRKPPA